MTGRAKGKALGEQLAFVTRGDYRIIRHTALKIIAPVG